MGLTNLLLHDYAGSENAFRDALQISSAANQFGAEIDLLLAQNAGSLGWTLAMTGRLREAETHLASSIRTWESLHQTHPGHPSSHLELAAARRNLAMIRHMGGGDGLADALASIEAAKAALIETPARDSFQLCRCHETLVDSEQFVGMLYWRRGQSADAERICRSSINHLQQLLNTIESLFESNQLIPRSKKYSEALRTARKNLELSARHNADSLPEVVDLQATRATAESSDGDWRWKSLRSRPGQILPMDFIVRGTRYPGEFETHDALLVSWQEEWIVQPLKSIISAVHGTLPVIVVVDDQSQQSLAEHDLRAAGISMDQIHFVHAVTDTPWVRDYGPMSVQSASLTPLWIDSVFTYASSAERFEDDELPQVLSRFYDIPTVDIPVHFQGGAVLNNGDGICLVSSDLLHRNHRLGTSPEQIISAICQYFGAEQVVVLDPLVGESTGHLDWFCTFTSPDTVVLGEYGPEDPVNRDLLHEHARLLGDLDVPGGKLNVVRIPMPPRAKDYFGGSYTNVIFANGVLVVPTWPEASMEVEQQALDLYRQLLPDWEIVTVPSRLLGLRGGGPHCCCMNLLLRRPSRNVFRSDDPGT